jgi:recombination protein RecT
MENKTNTNTEAVSRREAKRDIRSLIQSDAVKQQMAMVLPKHLTADRMARVACTAILKTPKLAACRPESLLQALMLCSQAGLEPDGRNAHLIPYGDQVQVIFDWKGLVALARRNGVQNIAADIVCENDTFDWYRDGDGLHFKHQVDFRKARGEMFAAFCIWKDGEQFDGEVMTKAEIDAIRKRSRASGAGPWVTDYNEMAKKTVVRRSSKKWPLDAELAEALNDADSVVAPAAPAISRPIFTDPAVPALPEILAAEPEPSKPEFHPDQVGGVRIETSKPEFAEPTGPSSPGAPSEPYPGEDGDLGPQTSPTAQPEPSKGFNPLKALRGLMLMGKIKEGELLDWLGATGATDGSYGSLEDLLLSKGSAWMKTMTEDWPQISAAILAAKKKGKA